VSTHDENALSQEELEAQSATGLPAREAMSTLPVSGVDPAGTIGAVGDTVGGVADALPGGGLLDLDVNVDLNADAAAPISAAVAANANVAAPIDAAVSANVASPDAVSMASAPQTSLISQDLDGVATANVDQASSIAQDAGGTGS
jgi:hypothetical protein